MEYWSHLTACLRSHSRESFTCFIHMCGVMDVSAFIRMCDVTSARSIGVISEHASGLIHTCHIIHVLSHVYVCHCMCVTSFTCVTGGCSI